MKLHGVQPSGENGSTNKPATATKGKINASSANIRKEPSRSAEVVITLIKNTELTIISETEEWYKIIYTSTEGTQYEGYIVKELVN